MLFASASASAIQIVELSDKFGVIDRLDHVLVETGLLRPSPVFLLPPARESEERHLSAPLLLADLTRAFIAVQPRQPDIEQHDVRPKFRSSFDGLASVMRFSHLMAAQL